MDGAAEEPGGQRPWDPSLYAGSAGHYAAGRVPYPAALVDALVAELGLDGSGRLLDVGCGPGSLTLLLAPHVAEAVGVEADADMLAEAARLADRAGVRNVVWQHLRAEDLPDDVGAVDVATLAQSFHWMDRPRVAAVLRGLLRPGGALVHVHATTHEGSPAAGPLPHPSPPRAAIASLVRRHLGPVRRAGQGYLPAGTTGGEDAVYRGAGFIGPRRLEVAGWTVTRTATEVRASVYSLSSSTPHLFGERLSAFDAELTAVLAEAAPDGLFSERMRPVGVDVWR